MPTSNQNATLTAGDTAILRFTALNSVGGALSLVGAEINWQMRRFPGDTSTALISKSVGSGIAVIGSALDGIFEVTIDPSDTVSLPVGRYWHAAGTETVGDITTIAGGFIVLVPRVILP